MERVAARELERVWTGWWNSVRRRSVFLSLQPGDFLCLIAALSGDFINTSTWQAAIVFVIAPCFCFHSREWNLTCKAGFFLYWSWQSHGWAASGSGLWSVHVRELARRAGGVKSRILSELTVLRQDMLNLQRNLLTRMCAAGITAKQFWAFLGLCYWCTGVPDRAQWSLYVPHSVHYM